MQLTDDQKRLVNTLILTVSQLVYPWHLVSKQQDWIQIITKSGEVWIRYYAPEDQRIVETNSFYSDQLDETIIGAFSRHGFAITEISKGGVRYMSNDI